MEMDDAFFAAWNDQITQVEHLFNVATAMEVLLRVVAKHCDPTGEIATEFLVAADNVRSQNETVASIMLDWTEKYQALKLR